MGSGISPPKGSPSLCHRVLADVLELQAWMGRVVFPQASAPAPDSVTLKREAWAPAQPQCERWERASVQPCLGKVEVGTCSSLFSYSKFCQLLSAFEACCPTKVYEMYMFNLNLI